jgi:hypothetical protein
LQAGALFIIEALFEDHLQTSPACGNLLDQTLRDPGRFSGELFEIGMELSFKSRQLFGILLIINLVTDERCIRPGQAGLQP